MSGVYDNLLSSEKTALFLLSFVVIEDFLDRTVEDIAQSVKRGGMFCITQFMDSRCKRRKIKLFGIVSAVAALVIGAIIYLILFPEAWLLSITQLEHKSIIDTVSSDTVFIRIIRNYGPDLLWAYALTMIIYAIYDFNKVYVIRVGVICSLFIVTCELCQLFSAINATFDIFDIIVELIAEIMAFVVVFFFERRIQNAEKN